MQLGNGWFFKSAPVQDWACFSRVTREFWQANPKDILNCFGNYENCSKAAYFLLKP